METRWLLVDFPTAVVFVVCALLVSKEVGAEIFLPRGRGYTLVIYGMGGRRGKGTALSRGVCSGCSEFHTARGHFRATSW